MTKTFCDRCNEEIKEEPIWVFEQELCPKCAKELREQFSKLSMRVNSDNCEDKSNGATDREIELQQIIQNQKIYITQLKAEICDSSEYCAYCAELDMSECDYFICKYKKKKIPAVCYWQVLTPAHFDDIPWTKSDKGGVTYDR